MDPGFHRGDDFYQRLDFQKFSINVLVVKSSYPDRGVREKGASSTPTAAATRADSG